MDVTISRGSRVGVSRLVLFVVLARDMLKESLLQSLHGWKVMLHSSSLHAKKPSMLVLRAVGQINHWLAPLHVVGGHFVGSYFVRGHRSAAIICMVAVYFSRSRGQLLAAEVYHQVQFATWKLFMLFGLIKFNLPL